MELPISRKIKNIFTPFQFQKSVGAVFFFAGKIFYAVWVILEPENGLGRLLIELENQQT